MLESHGTSVRTARKDGRDLVRLERVERGGSCVVLCEVYPVASRSLEPLRPGPYSFGTAEEASAFVEESLRTLAYLGCDVG